MKNKYEDLLNTPQWSIKREIILKRDYYKCRNCGSKENLNVHHRQYHSHAGSGVKFMPWEYHNRYLITLCSDCHKTGHNNFKIQVFYL
jgi:5-methylcytosine-specific restriction endonuclease McrA